MDDPQVATLPLLTPEQLDDLQAEMCRIMQMADCIWNGLHSALCAVIEHSNRTRSRSAKLALATAGDNILALMQLLKHEAVRRIATARDVATVTADLLTRAQTETRIVIEMGCTEADQLVRRRLAHDEVTAIFANATGRRLDVTFIKDADAAMLRELEHACYRQGIKCSISGNVATLQCSGTEAAQLAREASEIRSLKRMAQTGDE